MWRNAFVPASAREGRAIGGLSMGGYGALKFGVKYPEMFAFAASMSGALGAASWTKAELGGFEFIWQTLVPVYGAENSETRAANDISKLYRELPAERSPPCRSCISIAAPKIRCWQPTASFVDILLSRKIPHEYRQLPGRPRVALLGCASAGSFANCGEEVARPWKLSVTQTC